MITDLSKQLRIVPKNEYSWRATKSLVTIKTNTGRCPRCSAKLYIGETGIPTAGGDVVIVPGEKCQYCDCLYITDKLEIEYFLRDNKNATGFTLDGKTLWDYTARYKEAKRKEYRARLRGQKRSRLRGILSGVVLLTVQFHNNTQDYIIVRNVNAQNRQANVLHYSGAPALELLTAAFRESRDRKGEYDKKRYHIADIIYPEMHNEGLRENLLPMVLNIKSGGGLYEKLSSEFTEYKEIVDVLLYSPFTERYELIRATYDGDEDYCYTDARLYREFVENYGKPDLATGFGSSKNLDADWSNLQIESALRQYGYSVGQKSGLREQLRQELLAELVDLELLDVTKIVRLLSFFISSHTSPTNYAARLKWESDRDFISRYKVNPDRFLIAK